jgi:hypothetical protein
MADNIKIHNPSEAYFVTNPIVASGSAASIARGCPTKMSTSGYVAIMVDADGTLNNRFTGVSKSTSTDTAAADGNVELWLPLPGLIYVAAAKTAANADTQAEIDALYGKRVIFDLTSTVWSVDTGATDASTNCLIILGGDYQTSLIYFAYGSGGTIIQ